MGTMPEMRWRDAVATLTEALAPAGLDLVQPGRVTAYNAAAPEGFELPTLGHPDPLVVLIGASAALWPPFSAALAARPELRESTDPLDEYTREAVSAAVDRLGMAAEIRLDHEPRGRRVAMQLLAEIVGLAWQGTAYLSVHPRLGPWLSLRGAVVLGIPGPSGGGLPERPCDACEAPCLPALDRALRATPEPIDQRAIVAAAREWIALRDACPVGRAHRYSDAQLAFHYRRVRP